MFDAGDILCPALRNPLLTGIVSLLGYFGHPAVGIAVGIGLLGLGHFYKNDRWRLTGLAVLIAVCATVGIAEIMKRVPVLSARPAPAAFGFPSAQSGAAFALASALGVGFPGLGPIFFGCAILAAIGRLYLRTQYLWNIIGGAALGLTIGLALALRLTPRDLSSAHPLATYAAWSCASIFGLAAFIFFYSTEKQIALYLADSNTAPHAAPSATFDFGSPQARPALRYGWWNDESWRDGKRTVVWGKGLASEFVIELPAEQDYRVRLSAFPYFTSGPACQKLEVRVNNLIIARIALERGWHFYQFGLPKAAVRPGRNFVQFFYSYAESPKSRGRNGDERSLSVAFDVLEAVPVKPNLVSRR